MNVIYKAYINERQQDEQFPNLCRFFKREIVESGMDNPHLALVKYLMNNNEVGITYSIGVVKQ